MALFEHAVRGAGWLATWLLAAIVGSTALVRVDIADRRSVFLADAALAHRLLSQRAAQHDAILAMLGLLDPRGERGVAQRLSAVYPQVLSVEQARGGDGWTTTALATASERSRAAGHAVVADFDATTGRYWLVRASRPDSHALRIDARALVPWADWPIPAGGAVQVQLRLADRSMVLQPGLAPTLLPFGLTDGFVFAERLAPRSQPFELRLHLATGPAQWPWGRLAGWLLASGAMVALAAALLGRRREQRRSLEIARLGKVARLDALGELAAQMAHELNQPLAAALANAQAARRWLDDEQAEPREAIGQAKKAIAQAGAQARRAADVVARLRRLVAAQPSSGSGGTGADAPVSIATVLRVVLDVLEPRRRSLGVRVRIEGDAAPVVVDPVVLEQILHNLVDNAFVALSEVVPGERRLSFTLASEGAMAVLFVRDSGRGFEPQVLDRLFEPFFTTRAQGMGLGLSLSRNLAEATGGSLQARNARTRGAELALRLPIGKPGPSP